MTDHIRPIVLQVLTLLAKKQYAELEMLTQGVRLCADHIDKTVAAYGRSIVVPPDSAFEFMDVIRVTIANPSRWSVTMPIWTQEEGRSDLSIELTVIDTVDGPRIEIDDLHVL